MFSTVKQISQAAVRTNVAKFNLGISRKPTPQNYDETLRDAK
jgi:hypothetical protein